LLLAQNAVLLFFATKTNTSILTNDHQNFSAWGFLTMQSICPPCRQDLGQEKFVAKDLFVEFKGKRMYVCCSGCADKMKNYWVEYVEILGNVFKQAPVYTQTNIESDVPVVVNEKNHGICAPCATGLCMLKEHLPERAQRELVSTKVFEVFYNKVLTSFLSGRVSLARLRQWLHLASILQRLARNN
jgi:hypothetical protein